MNNIDLQTLTSYKGKKLMKSYQNALKKMHELGIRVGNESAERVNPYSGAKHTLEPLAVTLYDFIIDQHAAGMVGRLFPVQTWDNARYLFLTLWPDEYYDLID
jgi:hypothetical protein